MSAARPPEGAHTAAREGGGLSESAARPPEGAHTAAREGGGLSESAARPPEGAHTAAREGGDSSRHAGAVIVTGGTFGLGQSIAVELARRGWPVVAFGLARPQVSSTAQGLETLRAELDDAGLQADVLEADVSCAADVQRIVQHTLARHGRIHGLVNNAAIGPLGTVLTTGEDVFARILDVNVKGTYLMSREVLPHMIAAGGGAIVNIGSGAGYGKPNMAAYSASKGAIVALSMAMAYDHFHDRVRVNVAIPGGGGIVTGMSVGRFGGDADAFRARPAPGTAAGRPATGRDLAQAVAFLLSDEAAAISGTVLDVGCFAHQGGPVPPRT